MNILLYTILFLVGIIVGSFWKRAIYRIPRNMKLTKKVSYYKDANHKLTYEEVIQELSFMLLGGVILVVLAKILQIDASNLKISAVMIYLFTALYLTVLILIAGIDKENIKIEKRILIFGIITSILYIVYLYSIEPSSIYINTISLGIYVILLVVDTSLLRMYAKNSYIVDILMLLNIILIFAETEMFIYTIIMSIIAILIYMILLKIKQKKTGNKKIKLSRIPVGYFISISNIIILFMMNFIISYCI